MRKRTFLVWSISDHTRARANGYDKNKKPANGEAVTTTTTKTPEEPAGNLFSNFDH